MLELSWKYRVFREKISLSLSLFLCLSTRLREIFFLPLGSRVLIGQRNFEGIVFWERACMRVYTRRGAVIREQGFAQGLVTDLENSGKLERTIGRWKTLWTMDDRGRYVFCIKVSTSNLSLYIVASQLLISKSLPSQGFQELSTTFNFEFRNSIRIFRETGKLSCLIETILVSSARRILVIPFYLIAGWIRTLLELVKGLLWK